MKMPTDPRVITGTAVLRIRDAWARIRNVHPLSISLLDAYDKAAQLRAAIEGNTVTLEDQRLMQLAVIDLMEPK